MNKRQVTVRKTGHEDKCRGTDKASALHDKYIAKIERKGRTSRAERRKNKALKES